MKFNSEQNSKSLFVTWFIILLFLIIFIAFPLFNVFITARPKDYLNVFSQHVWQKTIFNTFLLCICSSFSSVLVGYLFAYAIVKVDIPGKRFFSIVPLIHLITPPFVGGLAFILLFGRQGFITQKILD